MKKHLKYLVQFCDKEASWQPANNLTNHNRLLADFYVQYPIKPGLKCNVIITGPTNHRLHVIQSRKPAYT